MNLPLVAQDAITQSCIDIAAKGEVMETVKLDVRNTINCIEIRVIFLQIGESKVNRLYLRMI